ncbi:hypothetical protein [Mycobacterium sp. NPDC050441]|uniref:hypothetical protein n=1 Tax=Mycobacterium sp. NPDC050441 TaxID=3155403 RepID=UPI0033C82A64
MLAIVVAVVITVLIVKPDSGSNGPSNAGGADSPSEFASANDTGPVNIITEDPTCAAWGRVYQDYVSATRTSGWAKRDKSAPATAWTPEQRTMYETVGKARTRTADQAASLTKQTPHRVMRELYSQFVAYSRLAVASIPTYVSADNILSGSTDSAASALANICSAIHVNVAQTLAPLVAVPGPPSEVLSPDNTTAAEPFLAAGNPNCADWGPLLAMFDDTTAPWRTVDAKIPASDWTPEQRVIIDSSATVMSTNAEDMERLGRASGNPTFEDIAVLATQYRRAYVLALPNYRPVDNYLSQSAVYLSATITWSCKATS